MCLLYIQYLLFLPATIFRCYDFQSYAIETQRDLFILYLGVHLSHLLSCASFHHLLVLICVSVYFLCWGAACFRDVSAYTPEVVVLAINTAINVSAGVKFCSICTFLYFVLLVQCCFYLCFKCVQVYDLIF